MTSDGSVPVARASQAGQQRVRVTIQGAVQGVGFRPFVYRLATELGLMGWVVNNSQGVFLEVEGDGSTLQRFLARLPAEKPPRALIQTLDTSWLPPAGFERFEIRHSEADGPKTVLVLPDVATCPDCLAEVQSAADRRYHYPFINCTNCGPRFTIIQGLPYDRPHTTMRRFAMCPACEAEYRSPLDRRFHAQPNACPVCGPQLALFDSWQASRTPIALAGRALQLAAEALRHGQIVAVKGLGGFQLVVDASNPVAIAHLREHKPRRDKPFALMVADLDQARALVAVSPAAEALLTAPEAPIVLLPRHEANASTLAVAAEVAPGNPTLGIMLPYTPLHHLLLHEVGQPVVATSGNLADEPICIDEAEAMDRLGPMADLFLVHDRPIARHVDDSVAWIVDGAPQLLRRARGYAPLPVLLPQSVPTLLAVGAHLKNTVALSVRNQVFISQHIGDLETAEAMAAFERVIADFIRLYEAIPAAIAHDLHPDYLSTHWALEHGQPASPLIPVQHHHAHLASCLADHGLEGQALGVTWDGTGYGTDGTIWGGEFLLGGAAGFQRVAHLRPFHLPGGDAAVKQPRRVAFALLWELYGDEVMGWEHLAPVAALPAADRQVLAQMLRRDFHTPQTTSVGRLFDGVAALLGLHQTVTFEGQAAMALEFVAESTELRPYPLPVRSGPAIAGPVARSATGVALILDWQPLLEAILADLRHGVSSGIMAARFHLALTDGILALASLVGESRVALTGGCFQNRLLIERTASRLREAGFQVLLHRQVPPNDGGISLGQIAVAAAQLAP